MLLTETKKKKQEEEEKPEEFFARFILTRAFEEEENGHRPEALKVGLLNPNTAYELASCRASDTGDPLFMVRIASYPSRGIEDWVKFGIFSTRREAQTYVHFLKRGGLKARQGV